MDHRDIREMTVMWRHYRYLRSNPKLLPEMARIQERVSDLPVYHIPKDQVPEAERYLRDGDIIAVTSRDTGGYTSHVGLAHRDQNGVLRFLHASSRYHQVILDDRLSAYLADKHDDAGIIVARPQRRARRYIRRTLAGKPRLLGGVPTLLGRRGRLLAGMLGRGPPPLDDRAMMPP